MKSKKFLALLMSLCMSVGVLACGADNPNPNKESSGVSDTDIQQESSGVSDTEQESSEKVVVERVEIDESKFAGQTLVYGGYLEYNNQEFIDNPKSISFNHYWEPLVTVALAEWCAKNNVTLEIKDFSQEEIVATVLAGDKIDITTYGPYGAGVEMMIAEGAIKPITEYYNNFADYTSYAVDGGKVGAEWYGFYLPNASMMNISYSKEYFDQRGVKRPDEYFMEGNWTWETFQELCEEIGGDTDGDGVVDVYALANFRMGLAFSPEVHFDEASGQYVTVADKDKNFDLYQMMFELYNQGLIYDGFLQYPSKGSDDKYVAMGMGLHTCGYIDQEFPFTDSSKIMSVPVPAYKEGEAHITTMAPFLGVSKTGDSEMAAAALEYVLKFFESYTNVRRRLLTREEGLGWFVPQTPSGERALFVMDKIILKDNWEEKFAERGIDYAYIEAYLDYIMNAPKIFAHETVNMGNTNVAIQLALNPAIPPATLVAEQMPLIESKLKEMNELLK